MRKYSCDQALSDRWEADDIITQKKTDEPNVHTAFHLDEVEGYAGARWHLQAINGEIWKVKSLKGAPPTGWNGTTTHRTQQGATRILNCTDPSLHFKCVH